MINRRDLDSELRIKDKYYGRCDVCLGGFFVTLMLSSSDQEHGHSEEMVREVAGIIIGAVFTKNMQQTIAELTPIGLGYTALADLVIGITIAVQDLVLVIVMCVKGLRDKPDLDDDDIPNVILPRRIRMSDKLNGLVVWTLTSIYYGIENKNDASLNKEKVTTAFFIVVTSSLGISFIFISFTIFRICIYRCKYYLNRIFLISWSYLAAIKNMGAMLSFWIILFNNRRSSLKDTRDEINSSETLLVMAKIFTIWAACIDLLSCFLTVFLVIHFRKALFVIGGVHFLFRVISWITSAVFLFTNKKTAFFASMAFYFASVLLRLICMCIRKETRNAIGDELGKCCESFGRCLKSTCDKCLKCCKIGKYEEREPKQSPI